MLVNSPYNNSYAQYNHAYQSHDQFGAANAYQHQNYELNFDNTDYYSQQYMLKQQQQHHQQQQQVSERERELQKERELKERELNEKQQRRRFLVELEFVQCLANPNYLHFLAKQGMFDNDSFKNYLKYLLYWKKPEYVQFIRYPECLFFLELIQHDELQQMIKDKNCVHFICEQQMLHWKYNQESFIKTVKAMVSEASGAEGEQSSAEASGLKSKASGSMVGAPLKQKS
ncbi:Mediator of RNA polymerase II transcription subunit 31 [Brachionus plicatilis]|uniref:Mediator of RNA polymerase II transcription subunit 31 n=1 Tax=Brachionus plicatilis TaxID=10195 RepID=A0A3M7SKD8_BRAPC|nr:Mediator of RNA polymerase II transcription subunit 31 [Brachionus plicatilis]